VGPGEKPQALAALTGERHKRLNILVLGDNLHCKGYSSGQDSSRYFAFFNATRPRFHGDGIGYFKILYKSADLSF